jgi:hypothetical protein
MTSNDLDLTTALRDLAGRVPDDPTRLASVHLRYRRQARRRRAVGASALVATMAAGLVGAEALTSSGHQTIVAAGPVANLPACVAPPAEKSPPSATPPSVGQSFSDGGKITALGSSTITVDDLGPPLLGTVALTVTPATKLFRASPQASVTDQPTTIDQLDVGDTVKFSAVHSSATTNTLVELHAGASAGTSPAGASPAGASAAAAKQASADQAPTPPPVGSPFKAGGTVTAYSPGSLTVNVDRGNLTGAVTFTLHCAPALPVVGHTVNILGTHTATDTYDATVVALSSP